MSAGQGGQEVELFDGAAVPGGHNVHSGAPPVENEPSPQLSQALLEPLPGLGLNVPGPQLVQAVLEELPELGLYVPAAHCRQLSYELPVLGL